MTKKYVVSLLGALCIVMFGVPANALDLSLNDAVKKITAESNDLKKASD